MPQAVDEIRIRNDLRMGDVGAVIRLHGEVYAREQGWDWRFEAFAAGTFGRISERWEPSRDRIWIAERAGEVVGCIAILAVDEGVAQLRWFLVVPSARGRGLGRLLIDEALSFCRSAGHSRVFLWTTASLAAAAHLYRSRGFVLTHQETLERWGAVVTEERYDLDLSP
ncbi:MAG TPA: GNAT family N-acetyltransferase [Longimicrobiales bacterium]|nr:GNAT family N-acetyltransferase [Longimicrobiales bacterium]